MKHNYLDLNEIDIIRKESKRVYNETINELDRLQSNLGAEINFTRDQRGGHDGRYYDRSRYRRYTERI